MTNDDGRKLEGAQEPSSKARVGVPSGVDGNGPKRFSVQRKMAIVARLLRGEPLELVARETNVSIARLGEGYRKLWARLRFAGVRTSPAHRDWDAFGLDQSIPPYGYLEEEQKAATCMYVKCTAVRFALHVPVGDTKAHLTAKYVSVKNR
jgi:hypothetical protein